MAGHILWRKDTGVSESDVCSMMELSEEDSFPQENVVSSRIPQAILKKSSIVFSRASDMIRRVISSIK